MNIYRVKKEVKEYIGHLSHVGKDINTNEYRIFKLYIDIIEEEIIMLRISNEREFNVKNRYVKDIREKYNCIRFYSPLFKDYYWLIKDQLEEI